MYLFVFITGHIKSQETTLFSSKAESYQLIQQPAYRGNSFAGENGGAFQGHLCSRYEEALECLQCWEDLSIVHEP